MCIVNWQVSGNALYVVKGEEGAAVTATSREARFFHRGAEDPGVWNWGVTDEGLRHRRKSATSRHMHDCDGGLHVQKINERGDQTLRRVFRRSTSHQGR